MKRLAIIFVLFVSLYVAANAQFDPNLRDTLRIGQIVVVIDPSRDTIVYLPTYFFVDDSLDVVQIPLAWYSEDGHIYPGNPIWHEPFFDWDDHYDTIHYDENLMYLSATRDAGGYENPEYYPLRQWNNCIDLRFIIEAEAQMQRFTIDTTVYNSSFHLSFLCHTGTGESEFMPIFSPGGILYVYIDDIETNQVIPTAISLLPNYPNPFNSQTVIEFEISQPSPVKLEIFDITGAKIATLINDELSAGKHRVAWDASGYPSGVYYYRLFAGENRQIKKMLLIK
jgi:hypothetical protein